ncbi:hypothetical protein [Actinomyces weissii]|uniref:DUF4276 family protein n=1 Tax=Actinomyces weissii TaxID=675090 RepID=A0A7T7MBI5_9ACTO|nr:hypothetical protein [Actinomyces weissii]QQM67922.1 hypothetical protein JG540_03410 [Actinomyces weissii]
MTEYWQCGFVGEGSSDNCLVPVLEEMLLTMRPGADITVVLHQWFRRPEDKSVSSKAKALEGEPYDLIFVHRDADQESWCARAHEVLDLGYKHLVPVVPVRMTEAWALADLYAEQDFQDWWSGKGFGFDSIESCAEPKKWLREYLSRNRNSLLSPRDFAAKRAEVLKGISVEGPVKRLEAWKMLCQEVEAAMCRVRPYLAGSQWGIV